MDFMLPEHARMMRALARRFVDEECIPVEQEMTRRDPDWIALPPDLFAKLRKRVKEVGLWALDVPKEYGGCGLDTVTYCVVLEELNRTVIGTALKSPLWMHTSPQLLSFLYGASDYQKKKYLYPMINGDIDGAIALTEPQGGSDPSDIRTTARRDGDYWVINGTKTFCTHGDNSEFYYLWAQTDEKKSRKGITLFLVDKDTPGVRMERIIKVIRPQHTTEFVFDNCRVPDRQRFDGSGWDMIQSGLWRMRFYLAERMIGMCSRGLDIVTNYSQQRVLFGQPLSQRQAIQWMLVDAAMQIHITRLMVLEAAWKGDQGVDVRRETFMIKLQATEMACRVLDNFIQCLGGLGLSKDVPIERWLREARVWRVADGPSEVLRMVLSRDIIKGWRP